MPDDIATALSRQPWASVDGLSLVKAASGLQLLELNRPHLLVLQRLAALGTLLPARPGAPPITASKLRSLLREDLVVSVDEDRVETDLFCSEVIIRGFPYRVLAGIRDNSSAVAEFLCDAPLSMAGEPLPRPFVLSVHELALTAFELSEEMCRRAGQPRSTAAVPAPDERAVITVPSTRRLRELEVSVTFTREDPWTDPVL